VPNALVITVNEFPGFAEMSILRSRYGRHVAAGTAARCRCPVPADVPHLVPRGQLGVADKNGTTYVWNLPS